MLLSILSIKKRFAHFRWRSLQVSSSELRPVFGLVSTASPSPVLLGRARTRICSPLCLRRQDKGVN